ncbi:MAG: EAL domain-containing protein [Alkalilacustris sp.]
MRTPQQTSAGDPPAGGPTGPVGAVPPGLVAAAEPFDPLAMVRDAVAHRRVCLAFQPVVQARAPHMAAFHEGLVRVQDRMGRLVPAGLFIEAIDAHPLGREIDVMALTMGLRTLQANPAVRLSINMSALSVTHRPWLDALRSGLVGDPTLAERLILEITEASAMGLPEVVCAFMRDLRETGIAFALDDFGAGATAFRYLRAFRFDVVKIDGQFTRDLPGNGDGRVLVSALVRIARHFEMMTVAERVETEAEAVACARLGVSCLQGYLFGGPVLRTDWGNEARLSA